jgi:hypothetical protein
VGADKQRASAGGAEAYGTQLDWFPMPIAPICWPASHTLARRLFGALSDTLPNPYDQACELVAQLAAENHLNTLEMT